MAKGVSEIHSQSKVAVRWTDIQLLCSLLESQFHKHICQQELWRVLLKAVSELFSNRYNYLPRIFTPQKDLLSLPFLEYFSAPFPSMTLGTGGAGHYSNQSFVAAIDADHIKVLDYVLYDKAICAPNGIKWERKKSLINLRYSGMDIEKVARLILHDLPSQWKALAQWKFGIVLLSWTKYTTRQTLEMGTQVHSKIFWNIILSTEQSK